MQIKSLPKQITDFGHRLSDIRFAGQVGFVVLVLLISWSGIKSIQTNYGLQKQITALQQQNALQSLENKNMQLQSQYYNSNQYLELSSRQNFGLADPGETELLVPASVAVRYTIPVPVTNAPPLNYPPTYQNNYQSWVNFFLHR